MKAVQIIAMVVVLMAAGCRSSADESTQITSTAAESFAASDEAASDDDAVDPVDGDDEGMNSQPVSDPDEDGDSSGSAHYGDADDTAGADGDADDPAGDLDTDTVATGFLARVSEAAVEASTGSFEGRLAVQAAPGAEYDGTFELTLQGSYDVAAEALDISVDLSSLAGLVAADASPAEADMIASMFAEPVRLRSIGSTAWVRWGLLAGMFGARTEDGGTAWIEVGTDEAATMTGEFGVDGFQSPTDLLQTLAELDAMVTDVGRETVRGAETTHFEVIVDLGAVAAMLPPEERAELEAELSGGVFGKLPIDLWIGDDGLLRRLVVELDDLDTLGFGADAADIASVFIEFEIFDVGQPMNIGPPRADQVITTNDLGFSLDGGL